MSQLVPKPLDLSQLGLNPSKEWGLCLDAFANEKGRSLCTSFEDSGRDQHIEGLRNRITEPDNHSCVTNVECALDRTVDGLRHLADKVTEGEIGGLASRLGRLGLRSKGSADWLVWI